MNRYVKLTIATPEDELLDTLFVSVPESDLSPEEEVVEVIVDNFPNCAETMENLLKLDAIDATAEDLLRAERRK